MTALVLSFFRRYFGALVAWLDSDAPIPPTTGSIARWLRCVPFFAIHLGCLALPLVGVSWQAFGVALFLYCFRVFSLTAFYHRYFSHRSFKAPRFWQFIFAICGMTAAQRGPLWWAAHHRHHHLHSDTEKDAHSPLHGGFWHSHLGWFTELRHFRTDYSRIPDFACYKELVFLNRFDTLVPLALVFGLYFLGDFLGETNPNVSGWQFVVWGGCLSTVAVYHVTFFVNSLCHVFGSKRFVNDDDSRNNWLVALLTFGEGWHNNHHRYPAASRQGFFWWEIDITYYVLRLMEKVGIVSNLKNVPKNILAEGKANDSKS